MSQRAIIPKFANIVPALVTSSPPIHIESYENVKVIPTHPSYPSLAANENLLGLNKKTQKALHFRM